MAARGAKGGNYDNPSDSTKRGSLPIIKMKKMGKDSVAIARTPEGDTIWRNTGERARGGIFYHPRDEKGKPKDRRYLKKELFGE